MLEQPAVERTEQDGIIVLQLEGEFDLDCVGLLNTAFRKALAESSQLVLDLGPTTFVDSTALGVILDAVKRAADDGGWVRLANPQPNIQRLLHVVGLDRVLDIHETVGSATQSDPDGLAGGSGS